MRTASFIVFMSVLIVCVACGGADLTNLRTHNRGVGKSPADQDMLALGASPPITTTISAIDTTVAEGHSTTIEWNTTWLPGVTGLTCAVKTSNTILSSNISGSESTGPLGGSRIFALSCQGQYNGQPVSSSAYVKIFVIPAFTVQLTSSATIVHTPNLSVTLTWSATPNDPALIGLTCSLTDGTKIIGTALSGTLQYGPIVSKVVTLTLSCSGVVNGITYRYSRSTAVALDYCGMTRAAEPPTSLIHAHSILVNYKPEALLEPQCLKGEFLVDPPHLFVQSPIAQTVQYSFTYPTPCLICSAIFISIAQAGNGPESLLPSRFVSPNQPASGQFNVPASAILDLCVGGYSSPDFLGTPADFTIQPDAC